MPADETLEAWGWDARWAASFSAACADGPYSPARVSSQDRDRCTVQGVAGAAPARIVRSAHAGSHPVTGDWVVVEPGPEPSDPLSITDVLPRRSAMSRGAVGNAATAQVLAANVDVVLIVHGLDTAINPRRLERYLTAAWESGASPEVVLTKADLADDLAACIAEVEAVAMAVPVHVVSCDDAALVDALRATLRPCRTHALLGPSGSGKSTLINTLAQQWVAATGVVREADRKGRHTTTRRELFQVMGGALLLDTPGLREFRVWSADEGLAQTFPEIEALAVACRFRDCRHESEPGCAVLAAVAGGALDRERLNSFRKLRAEAAYLERRDDPAANAAAVARHKTALKTMKFHHKRRNS